MSLTKGTLYYDQSIWEFHNVPWHFDLELPVLAFKIAIGIIILANSINSSPEYLCSYSDILTEIVEMNSSA